MKYSTIIVTTIIIFNIPIMIGKSDSNLCPIIKWFTHNCYNEIVILKIVHIQVTEIS